MAKTSLSKKQWINNGIKRENERWLTSTKILLLEFQQ
jgi:hypothetical protein